MEEALIAPTAHELAALPIFPLPNAVLFPHAQLPLHVFEPRYREMTRHVLREGRWLAVARLKPGYEADYAGRPPVHEICGVGRVVNDQLLEDGRYNLLLRGAGRVRLVEELPPERPFRLVRAELLHETSADPMLAAVWKKEIVSLFGALAPHLPAALRDISLITRNAPDAGAFADCVAAATVADPDASQALLEELDQTERLRLLAEYLKSLAVALSARPSSSRDLN